MTSISKTYTVLAVIVVFGCFLYSQWSEAWQEKYLNRQHQESGLTAESVRPPAPFTPRRGRITPPIGDSVLVSIKPMAAFWQLSIQNTQPWPASSVVRNIVEPAAWANLQRGTRVAVTGRAWDYPHGRVGIVLDGPYKDLQIFFDDRLIRYTN
jgi:hypothetical protein